MSRWESRAGKVLHNMIILKRFSEIPFILPTTLAPLFQDNVIAVLPFDGDGDDYYYYYILACGILSGFPFPNRR